MMINSMTLLPVSILCTFIGINRIDIRKSALVMVDHEKGPKDLTVVLSDTKSTV